MILEQKYVPMEQLGIYLAAGWMVASWVHGATFVFAYRLAVKP